MRANVFPADFDRVFAASHHVADTKAPPTSMSWWALPPAAQLFVACVTGVGVYSTFTRIFEVHPQPVLFFMLLATSCLTSAWKVNLRISPQSTSTLSVSYAANLAALLLMGPGPALIVAVAGAWAQCTFNVEQRYPVYRTLFSMAVQAITIEATSLAFSTLGGFADALSFARLSKPVVGSIAAYFLVNTGFVATAIALSTRQSVWRIWNENFLWSGPSFFVAGMAGATAAIVFQRGDFWVAVLMLAPAHLTYRTYQVFLGRIEDQRRHLQESSRLHAEAVEALTLARQAKVALGNERARLSVTLQSIGDGVIATNLSGTVALMNRAAEVLTGWTEDEALGQRLATVLRSLDRETREGCEHSLAEFARNPGKVHITRCAVLVARDLTERVIEEITAPLRDATGRTTGMVVAFRDISDALKAQEERARADKLASLGILAGGMAQDFNNALMEIAGNVSMLRATVPSTAPALAALRDVDQTCARARRLTWHLLTFSKGGVPIKSTIAIPHVLRESAGLIVPGSNVTCAFNIAQDLWTVRADEGQLIQAFGNILSNAQQAMTGGGTIEVRAENVFECQERRECALPVAAGPYVRVSIVDKGVGIPEADLGSIFDPYFSTKQAGQGLGLAVAYSVIKNHGGYLAVNSKFGRGTTVQVNLPAARAALEAQVQCCLSQGHLPS